MAEPVGDGSQPWWEATPEGRWRCLACVWLEPAQALPTEGEASLRLRARYTAGVEYVARAQDAAQPLDWQGDAVGLLFLGDSSRQAVERALEAAEALRERLMVDLGLKARVAVHAEWHPWRKEELPGHPVLVNGQELARMAPTDGVVLAEQVYAVLPEAERRRWALLGKTERDGIGLYVLPASLAERREPGVLPPDEDLRLWKAFWQYAARPEVRRLRYVGFRLQKAQPPSLDVQDVFVEPTAYEQRPLSEASLPMPETEAVEWGPVSSFVTRKIALVVLGDPGAGKTTLLRWLAVVAAGGPLVWAEHFGVSRWMLPLLVSVGRLADVRSRLGGATSFIEALAWYFHERNVGTVEVLRDFLGRELDRGQGLVLLDGLDEVRSEERESVRQWLEDFCARFPDNCVVLTSRRVGYTGFSPPGRGWMSEVVLGRFSDEQVHRYIHAFERAYRRWEEGDAVDDALVEREASKLLAALADNARLRDVARNPFLLSALALIHRAEGRLPRHRVHAYETLARTLCETWDEARRLVAAEQAPGTVRYEEEAIPILGELALRMHQHWPTGVAPEPFVIDTLTEAILARDGGARPEAERAARQFLEKTGMTVQLLLERGHGRWGFLHLTFQEFFTAVGLLSSERFEEEAFQHLFDPRWEEVLRLGVGYMALVQKRTQATQRFIRKVLNHHEQGLQRFLTEVLQKQVYLAALLTSEAGDVLPASFQEEVARAVLEWIRRMPLRLPELLLQELRLTDFAERLVDLLLAELQSDNELHRQRAVHALGVIGSTRADHALSKMVEDASDSVRMALCRALESMKSEESRRALAILVDKEYGAIRGAARCALEGSRWNFASELVYPFKVPNEASELRTAIEKWSESARQEEVGDSPSSRFRARAIMTLWKLSTSGPVAPPGPGA